jgi:four helix bundle protein
MLDLSHKKLIVYETSLQLIKEIYVLTKGFPAEEKYSLISQIRRASLSVCSNIAEGAARISIKEKKRFYEMARGSLVEVDTQLEIAVLLGYYYSGQIKNLEDHILAIFKMLSKMINNL